MKITKFILVLLFGLLLVPSVWASEYTGESVTLEEFEEALRAYSVLNDLGAFDLPTPQQCEAQLLLCSRPQPQPDGTCQYNCRGTAGGGILTTPACDSRIKVCLGLPSCRAVCVP